jgi:glycosyltransferase involved in cell wall biosynthesis
VINADIQRGLVSVILPVFNRMEFLREAAAQVFAQTYRPLELILVDDGSTDETGKLCDEIAASHPETVRVVHRQNGGPGAARESGRVLARGEFLQYFDSDDQIDPRKIEVQVAALRANPDCGVAYCKTREFTRGEQPDDRASLFTGEKLEHLFPRLLGGYFWQTLTPLIRREISDAAGPWLPLRQEEDWEYDSRIAVMGVKLACCEEFLASAINHSGQRASGNGLRDLTKLRDRCKARLLILENALKAGVPESDPNRQYFAKGLFLLARQCGAAGLAAESKALLAASRTAAGAARSRKQRLYECLARLLGWERLGCFCELADKMNSNR